MKVALDNYGLFISHIESLSSTDSIHTTCRIARIHMAIYLDVRSMLCRLSLAFQQDIHYPVKAVRRVQEFTWTMSKLQLLIEGSLDTPGSLMTH